MTAAFTFRCVQTHTAVKFMLVSSGDKIKEMDGVLGKVYDAYSDFASKNPF